MVAPFRLCNLALAFLIFLGVGTEPARAAVLWYNGDYDNRDALANGYSLVNFNGLAVEVSRVYDDFVVPVGQTWTITSVFTNDQINYAARPVTTANWEIRSGVGAGNGGTVVARATGASATQTALSQNPGFYYVAPPVQISADVTSSVVLTAGTYWLMMYATEPTISAGNQAFVMSTSGLNSVGTPRGNDDNSFISNNLPAAVGGLNFASASAFEGGGTWDYSMGVSGTVTFAVPGPSSLILVAIGGLGTTAFLRRRSRKDVR